MHDRVWKLFGGLIAAVCLLAVAVSAPAALQTETRTAAPADFHVCVPPLSDSGDGVSSYLAPAPALDAGLAAAGLKSAQAPDLSTIPRESSRLTLRRPLSAPGGDRTGLFSLPDISGLSTVAKDERAVPLGNTTLLSMGPGGFGRIMTGRPTGAISNWSDAGETSISYVRPHVNVEMMLALEMPAAGHASDFEGPGMTSHAVLDIDHRSKVDSTEIGQRTNQFGSRPAPTPVDEPQTAVAVGLDMGILPTFLAQMGVSLSVVVSHGQETGDSRVALVGVTELPVDWTPREHAEQHPQGVALEPLGEGARLLRITPGQRQRQ